MNSALMLLTHAYWLLANTETGEDAAKQIVRGKLTGDFD